MRAFTVNSLSLIHIYAVMEEIEKLCRKIPESEQMLAIKGIGVITVAGFLAEVGDVRRFESPRQIQKLAGLSLRENSSGKHKGQTTISKRGRSKLRDVYKRQTMEIAAAGAAALGMKPYYLYRQKNMSGNFENVGYAREGKFGIYNILIMEEVQSIVALGAGSITKRVFPGGRIERCDNVKDVGLYIEKIDEMIERKSKLLGME